MIIGSHNSWSYLPPKQWWMRPFAFMARCQSCDIQAQYEKYGVRCFDLRIRFTNKGAVCISHGYADYKINIDSINNQLAWLNSKGDCYVRILHEVRNEKQYTSESISLFRAFCSKLENEYLNIRFWCGRNLFNWEYDYQFCHVEPTCEENYASVSKPRLIDDWLPYLYALLNNKDIIAKGTEKEILLIDYVNIQ